MNILFFIFLLVAFSWYFARSKAISLTKKGRVASRPGQYAQWLAWLAAIPLLIIAIAFIFFGNMWVDSQIQSDIAAINPNYTKADIQLVKNVAESVRDGALNNDQANLLKSGYYALVQKIARFEQVINYSLYICLFITCFAIGLYGYTKISPKLKVRSINERKINGFLIICSTFAVFVTLATFLSLTYESFLFFRQVNILDFLLGREWNVQSAAKFGALPLFVGTMMVAFIAMLVAAPIGLFSAIYMSEYAPPKLRALLKPAIEVLAGIPTVVYGFFAVVTFGPLIKSLFNLQSSEIILVAGIVMGIMIVPYVSSLADDVISSVPDSLRSGALGLGSTKSETIRKVVFPAALPGIMGGLLLAMSRAIGETMIVVMALSRSANNLVGETWYKAFSPFESTTTVTVTIVDILTGDTEFGSAKVQAAFALAITLFFATLALNVIALHIVRKYREQYD